MVNPVKHSSLCMFRQRPARCVDLAVVSSFGADACPLMMRQRDGCLSAPTSTFEDLLVNQRDVVTQRCKSTFARLPFVLATWKPEERARHLESSGDSGQALCGVKLDCGNTQEGDHALSGLKLGHLPGCAVSCPFGTWKLQGYATGGPSLTKAALPTI